jgi:hypothetical protein
MQSRIAVFFCLIGFVLGPVFAESPDSMTIQGRLSPATPIPGVIASVLRDGATVQVLTVDLIPDPEGVFTAALTGLDSGVFAGAGVYSVNLSSPTGEPLALIPLRSVPFALFSDSSKIADTLRSNPTLTGTLTADAVKSPVLYVNPWTVWHNPLADGHLEFLLPGQEGEVRVLSKLSLWGNLPRAGWGAQPYRIPEAKWVFERSENFFKWRILPTIARRGGFPGYNVVTDIRLDLDSSFYDPDAHTTTERLSIVRITKEGGFATAVPKSFIQEHPTDPGKEIYYFALEGPEAGTYVRGNARLSSGTAVIPLPEHFGMVTSEAAELTAQVTPLADCNGLYVARKSLSQLIVKELNSGESNVEFSYFVQGMRKGFENLQVIRDKLEPADPEAFSQP